jgi:hypothetical protein
MITEVCHVLISRRIGEEIVNGERIRVVVAAVQGDRVRLNCAPPGFAWIDKKCMNGVRSCLALNGRV